MLKQLTFHNFKTWEQADVHFGKITGLFGTNSSGKSSIIQFLLLLKQTKEATDPRLAFHFGDERTPVRLGSYADVVRDREVTRPIEWRIEWVLDRELQIPNPVGQGSAVAAGTDLSVAASIGLMDDEPRMRGLSYRLGDRSFELSAEADGSFREITTRGAGRFIFRRTKGRPTTFGPPTKGYLFPDAAKLAYQNAGFIGLLEARYEAEIERVFYLGPLRDYPKREYLWSGAQPTHVGMKGEYAIEAILAATKQDVRLPVPESKRAKPFQEAVAYWLKRLGLISSFEVKQLAKHSSLYQATVRSHEGGVPVLLTDVGFGVSQVLPVVVLLHYVPEGSTVILEQPEIHLHPLAQAHLADLMIYSARQRQVQVVVESHSEQLLLRLQRRIAEEQVSHADVKLYFCEVRGQTAALDPLRLDMFGRIENWPQKFMGDAFGEAYAAEKRRLKRETAAN